MSSIIPQFQYFDFIERGYGFVTPEKQRNEITVPGAPVKSMKFHATYDDYDSDEEALPMCLVHPERDAHRPDSDSGPMTISELATDDAELAMQHVTFTRGNLDNDDDSFMEYYDDYINDQPMTISELATCDETVRTPELRSSVGVLGLSAQAVDGLPSKDNASQSITCINLQDYFDNEC